MGHSFSSGCSSSSSRAGGLCRPLKVPRRLCCPITRKIMRQPVTLGIHTFEREAIEKHLSRYNTNPMTNTLLECREVHPNLAMQGRIARWLQAHNLTFEAAAQLPTSDDGPEEPEEEDSKPEKCGEDYKKGKKAEEEDDEEKQEVDEDSGCTEALKGIWQWTEDDSPFRPVPEVPEERRLYNECSKKVPDLSAVLTLLTRGANVNFIDNDDMIDSDWYTCLHAAAENGHTLLVRLLLAMGADVDPLTMLRSTPLHLAALRGHTDACLLLLDAGADPGARDGEGKTPLDLARDEGHAVVEELLRGMVGGQGSGGY